MLFDQYAPKFDQTLVDVLGYCVPELLEAAIARARPGRFGLVLDLGCGTGLMGERLKPFCDRLEGFDISAEMLRKARVKSVYDRLEKADLQSLAYDGPTADLVTAADVFMYVGALEGIVKTATGLLVEDGLFAFSVEKLNAAHGFALQPSRRYAHSEGYVRQVLGEAGLAVMSLQEGVIRQDRNERVNGLIVVARRG
jgi:predicted TPR repeat methyltransferase